jgi:hypothetical protein
MITETDEIAAAIDEAAQRWPELADERAELLRRLIVSARTDEDLHVNKRRDARLKAIRENAGGFDGVWDETWLRDQREEWPE